MSWNIFNFKQKKKIKNKINFNYKIMLRHEMKLGLLFKLNIAIANT